MQLGLAEVEHGVAQSTDSLQTTLPGGTLIVAQSAFVALPLVSGAWPLVRVVL